LSIRWAREEAQGIAEQRQEASRIQRVEAPRSSSRLSTTPYLEPAVTNDVATVSNRDPRRRRAVATCVGTRVKYLTPLERVEDADAQLGTGTLEEADAKLCRPHVALEANLAHAWPYSHVRLAKRPQEAHSDLADEEEGYIDLPERDDAEGEHTHREEARVLSHIPWVDTETLETFLLVQDHQVEEVEARNQCTTVH